MKLEARRLLYFACKTEQRHYFSRQIPLLKDNGSYCKCNLVFTVYVFKGSIENISGNT